MFLTKNSKNSDKITLRRWFLHKSELYFISYSSRSITCVFDINEPKSSENGWKVLLWPHILTQFHSSIGIWFDDIWSIFIYYIGLGSKKSPRLKPKSKPKKRPKPQDPDPNIKFPVTFILLSTYAETLEDGYRLPVAKWLVTWVTLFTPFQTR